MKIKALVIFGIILAGCDNKPLPWELVTAEEEKTYFFDCLKHAPISGTQIVQGCEESANNYKLTLGLERARNAEVTK